MDFSFLNKQQLEAVKSIQGPVLVIAGAGTGKTSVLTNRIVYLISELGVDPKRILAITFTNKAAEEMQIRIKKLLPEIYTPWIKTYHSTCLKILQEDIDKLGWKKNFTILDESDQISLVKLIIKSHNFTTNLYAKKIVRVIEIIKFNDLKLSEDLFLELSKKLQLPTEADVALVSKIYNIYCQKLKTLNQLDFSDLINFVYKLFQNDETIKNKWQQRFDYILVDEFQDTNFKQFEIIRFLVNSQNNIFAVGDPCQTIFTWRGAYASIFDDFKEFFPNTKVLKLSLNYRSTENILKAANNLISNNENNFKNELVAQNTGTGDVGVYFATCQDDEASFICSKIIKLIKNSKKQYSDIVILYRANYCSNLIEEKLKINQIPYVIFGSVSFYERKEIKDLISYLKVLFYSDDLSLMRIINIPKRSIGQDTIEKINSWCANNKQSFSYALENIDSVSLLSPSCKQKIKKFSQFIRNLKEKIKSVKLSNIVSFIVKEIKYIEYLQATEINILERKENLDELERSITLFSLKNPNASIIDFFNEINLFSSAEKTKQPKSLSVHLMTIHMAKGKEYDTVFIYNFNENVIPSYNSLSSNEKIEEERRIAYVAMTRSINNLFITVTADNNWNNNFHKHFQFQSSQPSRFLEEIKYYQKIEKDIQKISNKDLEWFDSKKVGQKNFYEKDLTKIYTNTYKFKIGDVVVHTVFGDGMVVNVNGSLLDVIFKKPYGKKTILASHNALKRIVN